MYKVLQLAILFVFAFPAMLQGQANRIKSFTEPYRSIEIATGEMGTLSKIEVEEGEEVARGMILARLNGDVLKASRAIAEDARDAQGKLNSALAEVAIQEQKFAKLKGLFDRRHASQIELDRAQGQLAVVRAQAQAVRDELRLRDLELVRIEKQIEQRLLRSPIDGIVTELYKDEGEFVSANDPNVVKVVQLNPLLVVYMVPQKDIHRLTKGQSVSLLIGNNRDSVSGQIEFISPTADAQTGTCRVKVKIDNSGLSYQSGVPCYLDAPWATVKPRQVSIPAKRK